MSRRVRVFSLITSKILLFHNRNNSQKFNLMTDTLKKFYKWQIKVKKEKNLTYIVIII